MAGFRLLETASQIVDRLIGGGKASEASTASSIPVRTSAKALKADSFDVSSLPTPGSVASPVLLLNASTVGTSEGAGPYANGINKYTDGHLFFVLIGATGDESVWSGGRNGEAYRRFRGTVDGKLQWGSGAADVDTNLYRSAANQLKTDDSLYVGASLTTGRSIVAYSASLALDPNLYAEFDVTLTGDIIITLSNSTSTTGQRHIVVLHLRQNVTGGHELMFGGTNVRGCDDISLTGLLSTGANKKDRIGLEWDPTDLKWDVISLVRGH